MPKSKLMRHPLYNRWSGAKQRCYYPGHKDYERYGGRGIRMHAPWHDAATFIREVAAEIGLPPPGHTLDRIDSNRHYEPGNIKWSTHDEQAANRRNTSYLTVDGERLTLYNALYKLGLSHYQACSAYDSLRRYALPLDRALRRFGVDMARVSDLYLAPKRANYGRKSSQG